MQRFHKFTAACAGLMVSGVIASCAVDERDPSIEQGPLLADAGAEPRDSSVPSGPVVTAPEVADAGGTLATEPMESLPLPTGAGSCGGDAGAGCAPISLCSDAGASCAATCPGCSIGEDCIGAASVNPDNSCQICDPERDTQDWSTHDGVDCDDGLFCTTRDTCAGGACVGAPLPCDDALSCNGVETCDDDNDVCVAGDDQCPANTLCDAVTDTCRSTCAGCAINGTCLLAGVEQPGNPCLVCNPAISTNAFSAEPGKSCGSGPGTCSGQDTCSASGVCQPNHSAPGVACGNSGSRACDQPDSCDGNGNCQQRLVANDTSCNDGQFCTAESSCRAGECVRTAARNCGANQTCSDSARQCQCQGCLVGGTCFAAGSANPNNACQVCNPQSSRSAFSANVGAQCGSGATECSGQDTCNGQGQCAPNHVNQGTRCGTLPTSCTNPDQCDGAGICQNRASARVEVCDTIDNDCDGAVNEGVDVSTDPNNCGACGRSCLGGTCAASVCQPFALVSGRTSPTDLILDANTVYWLDSVGVSRFPKSPSAGTPVRTVASTRALSLQRDGSRLYWAAGNDLLRVNVDGTGIETYLLDRQGTIQAALISDGFVYWNEDRGLIGAGVRSVASARASLSTLVVELVTGGGAADARTVGIQGRCFWAASDTDEALGRACPSATGLLDGQFNAFFNFTTRGFLIDGPDFPDVYVGALGRGLVRLGSGPVPEVTLVASSGAMGDVEADGNLVYYVDGPSATLTCTANGVVSRVPKVGGTPQALTPPQSCLARLAVDNEALYWTNFQSGQIMKMAKPPL